MALSEPIRDYLEALGGSISEQGIAGRRFQPAGATFAASALGSIGRGIEQRRALDTLRQLQRQRSDFEAKIGIPYDLFSKLGSEAQTEILRNVGLSKPPAPEAGSYEDIYRTGVPAETETGMGTGAFEGISGQVETAPAVPPYLTKEQLGETMLRRYGLGAEPNPLQEAQIQHYGATTEESLARAANLRKGLTAQGGRPGGRGRSETENEIAAKRLAERLGGDWRDHLNDIKSGLYRFQRVGANSVQVYDEDGNVVTTYRYNYGRVNQAPADTTRSGGPVTVIAPNGKTYSFPDQASADRFKAQAGIR